MILIGLAFILFGLLVQFAAVSVPLAAIIVGAVYIVIALLKGDRA